VPEKPADERLMQRFLSAKEAAAYIGLTERGLKEGRRKNRIPYYDHGHKTKLYLKADLDSYLEMCRVKAFHDRD